MDPNSDEMVTTTSDNGQISIFEHMEALQVETNPAKPSSRPPPPSEPNVPTGLNPLSQFPIETLPAWAGDYARALAHVLQVDPAVVVLSIIGAVAIAVQRKARLQVRGEWHETLAFWAFVALRSGNRKTATLIQTLRPLRDWEREENAARGEYRRALAAAADATPVNAPDAAQRKRALKDATPPRLELFASDATPEAIAIGLAEQNETFAIVTDEPTSLQKIVSGLYSDGRGANTGILMAAYTGSSYRRKRVKSEGAFLEQPVLSLLLFGQPSVFSEMTASQNLIDLGFVGRLLVARPPDLLGKRKVHGDAVPESVRDEYHKNMTKILDAECGQTLPDVCALDTQAPPAWPRGPLQRETLRFTPEAMRLHLETEQQIEPMLAENGVLGDLSDFGGKLSGLIARAAALVHVLHHPSDWWQQAIGAEAMRAGIAVGRYALGQVLDLYAEGARERRDEDLASRVLQKARQLADGEPPSVTWRKLSRALVQSNGRGRIQSAQQLRELVELLVERGDLVPQPCKRGERWAVRSTEAGA